MQEYLYEAPLIVFEGIDGSGKSTQAKRLLRYLKRYVDSGAKYTKEPTHQIPKGNEIRKVLMGDAQMDPLELQKLYVEDRDWHLHYVIIPELGQGHTVICDRYFLSTVAYGSIDSDIDTLIEMNQEIEHFFLPDLTIVIDIDPKEGLKRRESDSELDIFEKEEKTSKVRAAYKRLARRFDDVIVINGARSEDEVFEDVLRHVNKVLVRRREVIPQREEEVIEQVKGTPE